MYSASDGRWLHYVSSLSPLQVFCCSAQRSLVRAISCPVSTWFSSPQLSSALMVPAEFRRAWAWPSIHKTTTTPFLGRLTELLLFTSHIDLDSLSTSGIHSLITEHHRHALSNHLRYVGDQRLVSCMSVIACKLTCAWDFNAKLQFTVQHILVPAFPAFFS